MELFRPEKYWTSEPQNNWTSQHLDPLYTTRKQLVGAHREGSKSPNQRQIVFMRSDHASKSRMTRCTRVDPRVTSHQLRFKMLQ